MLQLPNDLRKQSAPAFIARMLDNQVNIPNDRLAFSLALIGAALELSITAEWAIYNPNRSRDFRELPNCEWYVGSLHYKFIPVLNDDSFNECVELSKAGSCSMFIVPPKHQMLMCAAITGTGESLDVTVFNFDYFFAWRAMWACGYTHWTGRRYVKEWLTRYDERSERLRSPHIDLSPLVDETA